MKAFYYFLIFYGASIGYVFYNELILLPYQTWDPSGLTSLEEMASRDLNINVGVILGSYILLCTGSYAYVSYYEKLAVMDQKRSLTPLKGEVGKLTPIDVPETKGEM